jgi:hypothetical protein
MNRPAAGMSVPLPQGNIIISGRFLDDFVH